MRSENETVTHDDQWRALRTLITITADRLACFSGAYSTSSPREPKDAQLLKILRAARDKNDFAPGLLQEIETALRRHFWNTAMCAALFPATHTVEVPLSQRL